MSSSKTVWAVCRLRFGMVETLQLFSSERAAQDRKSSLNCQQMSRLDKDPRAENNFYGIQKMQVFDDDL